MVIKSVVNKIIIGIIGIVIGFCICFFTKKPIEKIKIVKETETEFKYITKVNTLEGYKNCYGSKLNIFTKVKEDNWIEITAKDKCKLAKKSIKVAPAERNNFVFVNYGVDNSFNISYYRKFNNILIGGGVSYPAKIEIGAGYNF